jgi:predicted amidohydrolase
MSDLKIGIFQMSLAEGDIRRNAAKLEKVIAEHANRGVDLLCFPELCVSGYDWSVAAAYAEHEKQLLSGLAKQYHQAVLAGVIVQENGSLFDAACIWDEKGSEQIEYRKIHLWSNETEHLKPGDDLPLVTFRGWKIALLICADLGFAELSTYAALQGADLIVYPSAWGCGFHFTELFMLSARMRAAENQLYTIALNRATGSTPGGATGRTSGGATGGATGRTSGIATGGTPGRTSGIATGRTSGRTSYCGHSLVCGPDGGDVLHFNHDKEAYGEVRLSKARIRKVRETLPWLQMHRPEVYRSLNS